jgi:RNA polymerase sigma-70 factor, ECF subfamily
VAGNPPSRSDDLAPRAASQRDRCSEGAVVEALRDGDERAFRELFRRKHGMMKRIARGFVGSDAVAEEIVQETWLAVVNGIDGFESRSSLDTWISSILVNQARKHGVRERRSVPFCCVGSPGSDAPSVDPDEFEQEDGAYPGHWATGPRPWQSPERRLLSLEAREHLKEALGQLPERQRLVVGLRDVEGRSSEEVCALLDLSEENQRVLLHRGRSRLRASLDGYLAGEAA